ncbi:2672_t:CDS:2, partial [Funneliformis geosporum]
KAIQAIQENNFETASDYLYSFYRKVARENGIQLSRWSTINKYIRKKSEQTNPLCLHEFFVSIKDFCSLEDFTTLSDRFPISAFLRDRTLILTWDIETYASQMEEFAEVLEQKNKVFMIGMTLHCKDDPKLLKQICIVGVETAPDPRWVTIICENQVNLLKAFALCWRAFAPDIQMWERMTGKFETKEKILKWKYCEKIGVKSENNFMMKEKKKDTDEKVIIWGSGEEVEEKKDYMDQLRSKLLQKMISFPVFLNCQNAYQLMSEKDYVGGNGINNTRSIRKIVEDALWNARFKQADERKNNKQRKKYKDPDSGKRFSYIVVNDGPHYKKDDSKSTRKGDYMKFPEIAKEFNMKIDIRHYLEQT